MPNPALSLVIPTSPSEATEGGVSIVESSREAKGSFRDGTGGLGEGLGGSVLLLSSSLNSLADGHVGRQESENEIDAVIRRRARGNWLSCSH